MLKVYLTFALAFCILFSNVAVSEIGGKPGVATAIPAEKSQILQTPEARAACPLQKHSGVDASYYQYFGAEMAVFTYFDPAVECGIPAYPYHLQTVSFTLYDPGGYNWPVAIRVGIYDLKPSNDPCDGPGELLYYEDVLADQATFQYPNTGTVTMTNVCLNGPFFIGLKYNTPPEPAPSILFDDTAAPDSCDNWMLGYNGVDYILYEWYDFWNQPGPGYPMIWADGESESELCPEICDWNPGEPHKMHYPQLPDFDGWTINSQGGMATIADDWECTESGWVKSIHWWGGWENDIIGNVLYYVIEIREDISADQNPDGYSKPGDVLWYWSGTPESERFDSPNPEKWYYPHDSSTYNDVHTAYYQYNLCLPQDEWFRQEQGTTYWLYIYPLLLGGTLYLPGDVDGDNAVTSADVEYLADYLFASGPPPHYEVDGFYPAADVNGDCTIDVGDWNDLLNYIDFGTPVPTNCEAYPTYGLSSWGWKSSADNWNDNAVWWPGEDNWLELSQPGGYLYIPGDVDGNGTVNGDDEIALDEYVYDGIEPPSLQIGGLFVAADVNGDCTVDESDFDYLWQYLSGGQTELLYCPDYPPILPFDLAFVIDGDAVPYTEACCLPGNGCQMLHPDDCINLGGIPQGAGSECSGQIESCCLPNGICEELDVTCCQTLGGTPLGAANACAGDGNGNSIDDACEMSADMKWIQAPDLSPTGIDVAATCPGLFGPCIVLADDFRCEQTGPITKVVIYGSWFNDMYPGGDPGMVLFNLSFHSDVPAGVDVPWSHPGDLLWLREFGPGQFMYEPYAVNIVEGYYDPFGEFYQVIADYTCWKYTFIFDDSMFIQQGTTADPVIYWLDVQAMPLSESYFGWKTSRGHWNDAAVWSQGIEPYDLMWWMPLMYPPPNEYAFESIDLAFEIYGGGEGPCDCLPGDANGDGKYDVADAVYLINFIFKGGPAPAPYALCSGDADCDCTVNVADAVYLINYIFKSGPPPCTCEEWLSHCGPPLRK